MATRPHRVLALLCLLTLMTSRPVSGHGRLIEPPSRSSMFRFHFNTPPNYNDNAINCGGINTQWYVNQGKCGVCGDPWNQPTPRDNEAGGRYGKGVITRTYTPGQTVEVGVEITANHKGWFEFRLCPHNDPTTVITQQCLDNNLLSLADGSGTRFDLGRQMGVVTVKVVLPAGVTCSQCVLQWKWHAANNYGTDSSGKGCMGCGPVQEEIYGCSDIAIGAAGVTVPPTLPDSRPATLLPSTSSPTLSPQLTYTPAAVTNPPFRPVSQVVGLQTFPPFQPITYNPTPRLVLPDTSSTPALQPATALSQRPGVTYPPFQPLTLRPYLPAVTAPQLSQVSPVTTTRPLTVVCHAVNVWQGVPELDQYCKEQCPLGNCPAMYCFCPLSGHTRVTPRTLAPRPTTASPSSTTTSTTASPSSSTTSTAAPRASTAPPRPTTAPPQRTLAPPTTAAYSGKCYGINNWQGDARLDKWCNDNCPLGLCPAQNCACGFPFTASPTLRPPSTPSTVLHTRTTRPPAPRTTLLTASPLQHCRAIGLWSGQPQLDQWCAQTCVQFGCDPQYCSCDPLPTSPAPTTRTLPVNRCYAVNGWAGVTQLDQWCDARCRTGLCPPMYCACGPAFTPSLTSPRPSPSLPATPRLMTLPRPSPTPSPGQGGGSLCRAINTWQGVAELDRWCRDECAVSHCPPAYCSCQP